MLLFCPATGQPVLQDIGESSTSTESGPRPKQVGTILQANNLKTKAVVNKFAAILSQAGDQSAWRSQYFANLPCQTILSWISFPVDTR
jgi:hypothetical protein